MPLLAVIGRFLLILLSELWVDCRLTWLTIVGYFVITQEVCRGNIEVPRHSLIPILAHCPGNSLFWSSLSWECTATSSNDMWEYPSLAWMAQSC